MDEAMGDADQEDEEAETPTMKVTAAKSKSPAKVSRTQSDFCIGKNQELAEGITTRAGRRKAGKRSGRTLCRLQTHP
jgi:hypothetical protein